MTTTRDLINDANDYLMNTYSQFPVVIDKGRGAEVFDLDGVKYLDFVSGLAVTNLGHCYPNVVLAIQKQIQSLIHISNLYYNKPQIELAALLVQNSFADRVFFCNSGAEANEAAIKLARKYSFDKFGHGRHEIITAFNSFHGRTMATISATGQERFHTGFEPLLDGFHYVPFSDIDAIYRMVNEKTAAIMMEPIQGEGGVIIPSQTYFAELRELCTRKDILLIFDEVQAGMGRTGKLFSYEHFGIEPDIMTLAKGLAGGMPIGAMLARDSVASAFTPGSHASTFGGNPVSCNAAIAVLEVLLEESALLQSTQETGEYIMESLIPMKKVCPVIREVRGKGLMIAIELTVPGGPVVEECLKNGLLINCTAGNIIRLLPPLNITRDEVDTALHILDKSLRKL